MTLPNLVSSSTNQSGTAVTTATFTRPAAAAPGDLLIAVLNCDVPPGAVTAFAALFGGATNQTYADGAQYVGYRWARVTDPGSWALTPTNSTACQAFMFAYRNVAWIQDRDSLTKTSTVTVSGVTDLTALGPDLDVLPIHILSMDQEGARTFTPGAGLTSAFDSTEPTTLLRTLVLHGAEVDIETSALLVNNSTLSVAEAYAISAFTVSGVVLPSTPLVTDGYGPVVLSIPYGYSAHVGDPLVGGGSGSNVPTSGQLWPRGV